MKDSARKAMFAKSNNNFIMYAGKKLSLNEEDLKKQIKPYNNNWSDEQFEDNEWKKQQLEAVRIKNGTHTKHDYSDPDSIVFNPQKGHYEQVCGHCGKVQGSHGRKGHGMNIGDDKLDKERRKIYAELDVKGKL
jgi:hypothetical protein